MKLSIITINFNNRDGLRKTIESVVNQTWQEFEYIIIDGGSTDGSVEVIKEFADRIDYWVSEPDKGIYDAMNKGIDKATGEYCLFMNSADIIYQATTLQDVINQLDGTDIISGILAFPGGGRMESPSAISMYFFYCKTLPHQATFIKSKLLKESPYDTNYKIVSDWKFWIRCLIFDSRSYKHISNIIAQFDINGISSTHEELRRGEQKHVLLELLPQLVLDDYHEMQYGYGYKNIPENEFYTHLLRYKYGQYMYSFLVCACRAISIFRPSAQFAWKYPIFIRRKIKK